MEKEIKKWKFLLQLKIEEFLNWEIFPKKTRAMIWNLFQTIWGTNAKKLCVNYN